jgi:hypothetical protein
LPTVCSSYKRRMQIRRYEHFEWTWPDDTAHIWELIVPHFPSVALVSKGLTRSSF